MSDTYEATCFDLEVYFDFVLEGAVVLKSTEVGSLCVSYYYFDSSVVVVVVVEVVVDTVAVNLNSSCSCSWCCSCCWYCCRSVVVEQAVEAVEAVQSVVALVAVAVAVRESFCGKLLLALSGMLCHYSKCCNPC